MKKFLLISCLAILSCSNSDDEIIQLVCKDSSSTTSVTINLKNKTFLAGSHRKMDLEINDAYYAARYKKSSEDCSYEVSRTSLKYHVFCRSRYNEPPSNHELICKKIDPEDGI